MSREYHVSVEGSDTNNGKVTSPFATINHAASIARPGDVVIVHEGTYRESVNPQHSGISDLERIVYQAADGERPVIKGSETVTEWEWERAGVWKARINNALFGDFNPFAETVDGDWLIVPAKDECPKHLGDVYINGKSCYEVSSVAEVYNAKEKNTVRDYVTQIDVPVLDKVQTQYVWYAEVSDNNTVIWVNFHDLNPRNELVEINVRKTCFFPSQCYINYITVSGFEMCQAATPWAPPTGPQFGIIGANWSRGWIIENNKFHDAKCSAVSIGKDISTGENEWSRTERKTGYQYQLEAVFKGLRIGWSKGSVGGHIVRDNIIFDCGQNAIVGHMGCAFSSISRNHIYRIGVKREYFGWEIAGIKFHAAVDTVISHNNIHDCSLGIWLDWQAQGTRITSNVLYRNCRDLMVEVSHGPCVVDNNILGSAYSFENFAQGSAFVNNLICGKTNTLTVLDRSTPYHFPHSTEVAGVAFVFGGDDRFANNIFLNGPWIDRKEQSGLGSYYGYPSSMEEYVNNVHAEIAAGVQGGGDPRPVQPVYAWNNAYCAGAVPAEQEISPHIIPSDLHVSIEEHDDGTVSLGLDADDELCSMSMPVVTTNELGTLRVVEELFENADGSAIAFDNDIIGACRSDCAIPGPLANLHIGFNRITVWRPSRQD